MTTVAKRWTCVEAGCDWAVVAPDVDAIVPLVQEHIASVHRSFELEDFIEAALEDAPEEGGGARA